MQVDGKLVRSVKLYEGKNAIDLPGISSGIYFLRIETGDQQRVEKLIRF
jgi:hypothetical protein